MARLSVVTAFKTEGGAQAEKEAQQLARAYDRVSAQLDPAVRNQQRYERAQRTLERALKSGKITQSEYNRQLELARRKYLDAGDGAGRFRRSIEGMTASFGRMAAAAAVAVAALAVVTLGRSLRAWEVEAKAVRQLEAALASTGNAAGRSVEQLQAHASALQRTTENANEDILVAQSQMLTFTKVSGGVFDRAIESVLDLSVRMDQDLRTSVIAVGKALNDPVRGLGSLSRAGIQFTDDQKKMVKALVEAGDLVGAQTIILKELEMQFGGSAQAARDAGSGLVPLQNAASDLMEVVGGGLAPAVRELAGDLETLAADPATVQFFADLGSVLGTVLSSLKMVTGQLDEFSIGWMATVVRASAGYAVLIRMNADLTRLLSKVIPTDHLKQLADDLDRHAAGAARAAQQAAVDLVRALAGLGPAAESAGQGASGLGDATGDAAGKAGELQRALDKATQSVHEQWFETKILTDVLLQSEERYETLLTQMKLGVPIREALAGALKEEAEALNIAKAALELELALRKEEKELLASILELRERIAERRDSAIDTTSPIEQPEIQPEFPLPSDEELAAMTEVWRETYGQMSAELEAMMKQAWANVQDIAADAIFEIFDQWIDTGNETLDTFLKSIAQMLSQMLVLWLANLAKRVLAEQAAAAASAAAWAAAGAASGGGGMGGAGGGWIGGLSTMYKAYQGAQTGGTGSGLMAGGAWGALAIGAVMAVWVAYLHSEAQTAAREKYHTAVEIGPDLETVYGAAWNEEFQRAAIQARDGLREILDALGGEISNLPRILVQVQGDGKLFRATVGDVFLGAFESYEEAMEAAMLEALSQADFEGVSAELVDAIKRGTIRSLDQLQQVNAIFQEIERVQAGDTAMSIRTMNREFDAMRRVLEEAGIAASVLKPLIEASWQEQRDFITGARKSARELFDQRMEEFNRELALDLQREEAALAAAEAQAAAAQAEVARLQLLLAGLQVVDEWTQKMFERYTTQLAAAQQLLASSAAAAAAAQAALDALPAPITPGEFRGGGGTRRSDMESLRDLIDQMRFDRLLANMTELEAGLARLEREYQDNLEKAHGNAELVAELTEEYRLQEEQLRQNIQLSAVETFQGFMGIGDDPFSQLRDDFETVTDVVRDAGFGAARTARHVARLTRRYEEQLAVLSRQQFVAIGDTLMGILERYYGGVEGFEEVRMTIERTRFELELALARQQFEILKAEGTLSDAVLAQMQAVFGWIDAHPIDWEKFVAPDAPELPSNVVRFPGRSSAVDPLAEVRRLLESYEEIAQDAGLSDAEAKLRQILEDFAQIFDVLGRNERTIAAFRGALEDLLTPIRENALQVQERLYGDPNLSVLGGRERYERELARFEELAAGVQGGEIRAFEEFPEFLQTFLKTAQGVFAGGGGYADVFTRGQEILDLIAGARPEDIISMEQQALDLSVSQHAALMAQLRASHEDSRLANRAEDERHGEGMRKLDRLSGQMETLTERIGQNEAALARVANALETKAS